MTIAGLDSNNKRIYNSSKFKYYNCCGINCNNTGEHQLMIIFIKKTGIFCDSCTRDLLERGLAHKIEWFEKMKFHISTYLLTNYKKRLMDIPDFSIDHGSKIWTFALFIYPVNNCMT